LAASSVTFSPVLPIGPFDDALLDLALVVLDLALVVLDEPFLLVDLFPLELLRRERVPEERVVFVAIFLASLWLPCLASLPAARFAPTLPSPLPNQVRIRTMRFG
jgi:hypothetical protein